MYTYETHLHTDESSRCGKTPARDYIEWYRDHGYSGIIVTDHFTGNPSYTPDRTLPWREQMNGYCRGYELALEEGIKRGFPVFFGVEQKFADDECLIYGIDKTWLIEHPDIVSWNRRQLLDEVEKAGGCIVHAHPFRVRGYVSVITLNMCVHAVEVANAHNRPEDDRYALAFARKYGFPMTAGTDMHLANDEQPYGMRFEKPLRDISDFVRAVKSGEGYSLCCDRERFNGDLPPLERPWDFRNARDESEEWSPEILFDIGK